jgi:hypothetical protein
MPLVSLYGVDLKSKGTFLFQSLQCLIFVFVSSSVCILNILSIILKILACLTYFWPILQVLFVV